LTGSSYVPGLIVVGDHYIDAPLGDEGDRCKPYTFTLVLANAACDAALANAPKIGGDRKTKSFPAACVIAGKIEVLVTY
jgi:hypothetical protein